MLRTKYQNNIKKLRIINQRLEKEIKSYNKPLQGGNLLIHYMNSQYKMIPNEKVSLVYIGDYEVQLQLMDPSRHK